MLQSFLANGRLKEIPASCKKRLVVLQWVVLQWLVRKFEPSVTDSERSLNEILQRCHPDSATLRREFIGYGRWHAIAVNIGDCQKANGKSRSGSDATQF